MFQPNESVAGPSAVTPQLADDQHIQSQRPGVFSHLDLTKNPVGHKLQNEIAIYRHMDAGFAKSGKARSIMNEANGQIAARKGASNINLTHAAIHYAISKNWEHLDGTRRQAIKVLANATSIPFAPDELDFLNSELIEKIELSGSPAVMAKVVGLVENDIGLNGATALLNKIKNLPPQPEKLQAKAFEAVGKAIDQLDPETQIGFLNPILQESRAWDDGKLDGLIARLFASTRIRSDLQAPNMQLVALDYVLRKIVVFAQSSDLKAASMRDLGKIMRDLYATLPTRDEATVTVAIRAWRDIDLVLRTRILDPERKAFAMAAFEVQTQEEAEGKYAGQLLALQAAENGAPLQLHIAADLLVSAAKAYARPVPDDQKRLPLKQVHLAVETLEKAGSVTNNEPTHRGMLWVHNQIIAGSLHSSIALAGLWKEYLNTIQSLSPSTQSALKAALVIHATKSPLTGAQIRQNIDLIKTIRTPDDFSKEHAGMLEDLFEMEETFAAGEGKNLH